MRTSVTAWTSGLLVLLLGCGSEPSDTAKADGAAVVDCGGPVVDARAGLRVECEDSACWMILDDVQPAVPDRGDNLWTLSFTDSAGAPLSVDSVTAVPFMPAHDHGTVPASFAGEPAGGAWTVGPFDLFMPGRWELRVTAELEGSEDDGVAREAVVAFCVEG